MKKSILFLLLQISLLHVYAIKTSIAENRILISANSKNADDPPTITLNSGTTTISVQQIVKTDVTTATANIKLDFKLKGKATAADAPNVTLHLVINAGKNATTLAPKFSASNDVTFEISIPKTYFKNDGSESSYTANVSIVYNLPKDQLGDPVNAIINADGKGDPYFLNFADEKDDMSSFWAEIGANFSMEDGFKPSNLYVGVISFKKDVTKFSLYKKDVVVSFTGGAYESQSKTISNSPDSGLIYRDGSSYHNIPNKGYPYYQDTGSVKVTTTVQTLGIFFSPHFRLNSIPTNDNGFHIYLSAYFEMLWQRVNSSLDYSKTHSDTILYKQSINDIYPINYKENQLSLDFRSHYLGIGLPVYLKDDDYTFYMNPVFGFTTQRFAIINQSSPHNSNYDVNYLQDSGNETDNSLLGYAYPKRSWNTFYIAQFRLTSVKYDVTFAGEIRGFMLANSKPLITLSISKKFDMGKLITGVLGKSGTKDTQ